MSKLYTDNSTNEILGVQVHVKYVDYFTTGGQTFYLVDAWVNYETELEAQVAYSLAEDMIDMEVVAWLDDPESFYGEPEIA